MRLYRHAKQAAEVDTVPFGSFRRTLIEQVGFFDESLLTNEDYEFNARVRKSGGKIWLDPSIRSIYFARSTLLELIRQYWRYGFWKWRMLRRYPDTLRWRQALPPLFVLSLIGLAILSIFIPFARILLAGELLLYFSIMILAGFSCCISTAKSLFDFGLAAGDRCHAYLLGQRILVEYPHIELSKTWLITFVLTPLRLRPSEYRSVLWMGDLLMAIASVFAALYTWRQYNFYVRLAELLARGVALSQGDDTG